MRVAKKKKNQQELRAGKMKIQILIFLQRIFVNVIQ